MRGIFDELRGASAAVAVEDLMAWEDVQDMVAEGLVTTKTIEAAIERVGLSVYF